VRYSNGSRRRDDGDRPVLPGPPSAFWSPERSLKPTRVFHFGPDVNTVGGTQSVIRTIATHRIGADVVRAVPTWDGSNQVRNARLTAGAARAIARSDSQTTMHFHLSRGGAWLREGTLIRLARVRGRQVVVSLHGDQLPSFTESHPGIVKRVLAPADAVTCLSEAARAAVLGVLPHARVHIVPNPVEVDPHSPPADRTPPVALFAGSISYRKGVDVLAAAWAQLLAVGVEGRCRLVGPPDDFTPPALERFEVESPVHPTKVGDLIRESRLVVLPSRSEGMPMILTEALAAARPFVATGVGGIRDITPDERMLIPVEDASALADAMRAYLEDAALAARAGELGQRHIARTRSPEVINPALRQIYARP
jgi:glycosyltransferase involved in cell wall biosynthesis